MFGSQPLVCIGSVPPFKAVSIVGVVSRMWEAFRCADGDSYWTGKIKYFFVSVFYRLQRRCPEKSSLWELRAPVHRSPQPGRFKSFLCNDPVNDLRPSVCKNRELELHDSEARRDGGKWATDVKCRDQYGTCQWQLSHAEAFRVHQHSDIESVEKDGQALQRAVVTVVLVAVVIGVGVMVVIVGTALWTQRTHSTCQRPVETGPNRSCDGSPMHQIPEPQVRLRPVAVRSGCDFFQFTQLDF